MPMAVRVQVNRPVLLVAALVVAACGRGAESAGEGDGKVGGPLVVYAAGSLSRPMRAALEGYRARSGREFELELAGSLELARRITELDRVPDVIALADEEVFPQLLMPQHVAWYARFARNRMVLAHAPRFTGLTTDNWWRRLLEPRVQTGRPDPDVDPGGYRTLFVYQLIESVLGRPGLADSLLAAAPRRHMRPKSADLVALLETGELDAAFMYESSALGARLPYVALGAEVDLGDEAREEWYATAAARVLGANRGDTIEVRGAPIRYGISIPLAAADPAGAEALLRFLFSDEGRALLEREHLHALQEPLFRGTGWETFNR
ncbi:MAG: extracellular solute-binding protein [Gemmatimonadota bacterium]